MTHAFKEDGTMESVMCVALYLGSSYASYGFSINGHDDKVYACKNWGTIQAKPHYHTLSTLLLDRYGKFVSFGYEAENHYNEISEDDLDEYDLFRNFPSVLCDKENIDEFTMIQSVSGREVAAIDLFSKAFVYLKDHLKGYLKSSCWSLIRWVVILPNKNDDCVKKFIRNAAKKARLIPSVNSTRLLLAHESEALASYCRYFGKNHDIRFQPGMKYIMMHAGDTKIDITTHKVLPTGHYEEITKPIQIHSCKEEMKEQFEMLLADTIGQECLSEFKMKSFFLWQKTLNSLEVIKEKSETGIYIPLDRDVLYFLSNSGIGDGKCQGEPHRIFIRNGMLYIKKETIQNLIKETVDVILQYAEELLQSQTQCCIFVVGTSDERKTLYEQLTEQTYPNTKIFGQNVFPSDLPIITGAVLFGYEPKYIENFSIYETDIPDTFYSNVLVAAIDLGTAYSGYAFSFSTSSDDVKVNKTWGSSSACAMDKTSTVVLVDSNRQFVSFGTEAESQYAALSKQEMRQYELFRNFKMLLYNKPVLDHFTKVISVTGRSFSALKVFTMALKYLKNHLMATLMNQLHSPPCNIMIKWVLTIPSLWDDSAKDFMRKAAKEAGLIRTVNSKQLLLVLEAEAASVYCRHKFKDKESFRIGTRYMLIDAGGGTADIATHEVLKENKIKEIRPSTGVVGGGDHVNSKFEELLSQQDVLGEKFISRYKDQYPSHWLTILKHFENAKRSVNISCDNKIRLPFESSIKAMLKTEKKTLKDITAPDVSFKNGALCIERQSNVKLFKPVVDAIIGHLKKQEYLINDYKIEYFFVVGGFGENKYFINRLETEFEGKIKVLKPDSSGHSVLVGAVLYGHDPKSIERPYPYRSRRRRVLISSN